MALSKSLNLSTRPLNSYSLELGKLTPSLTLNEGAHLSPPQREKLLLVKAEADLKSCCTLGGKALRVCRKTIRELYSACLALKNKNGSVNLPRVNIRNPLNTSVTVPTTVKGKKYKLSQSFEKPKSLFARLLSERKETAKEYIRNSRRILLSRILSHSKREETERMNKSIEEKGEKIRQSKERYKKEMSVIDTVVESAKAKASEQQMRSKRKTFERQIVEDNLEQLKTKHVLLKREVKMKAEKYKTLLEYKDFMLTLNPKFKETHKGFFMTEHGDKNDNEELDVIRSSLECEDEIQLNLSPPEGIINLLQKMEAESILLLQQLNERELILKQVKDRHLEEIQEKQQILAALKKHTVTLTHKVNSKQSELDAIANYASIKENTAQAIPVKKQIKDLIRNIYSDYIKSKKDNSSTISMLAEVTSFIINLRSIRTYEMIKGERVSELLKKEEGVRKLEQERAVMEKGEAMRKREIAIRSEMKKWEAVQRFKKSPKELMNKIIINKAKRVAVQKKEQAEDAFDDKYFI
eukprot:TRINITY_DN3839_c0_g1_i5.p1 TRINITY_DN3839_c0_g1~~TRINITY_DN3839_c0_g1_i5.p1  ORF type:complete len:524 (+),score=149.48 TRINITY_DN3839_c0_g1_i5:192-1763(+)